MTRHLTLRPYAPADLAAIYDICLRTADAGKDGTHLYRDPWVLGHRYAGPYVALEPNYAFVLDDGERVVGYILGVPDSIRFAAESEAKWFSLLRPLYPLPGSQDKSPDAGAHRLIHAGCPAPEQPWLSQYPAHLHIDLLPAAQGRGQGRALMEALWGALRSAGVPGVHLGVGAANPRANAFYRHLGFTELEKVEGRFWTLGYDLR
ncbi:GNAT family N-acetyltransferase [Deinococcus irradiatisoli]|uniref:GNAT family N-acetyltransferase n=1 Tax=Deinococcus irradiatisoli TaxID=2202254 RepID=A0A2Z3JM53_9DEIO|nr:GNAT family N-acetyltransferase [Deinococcus irradiatisoli]AWN22324.1 GNAT family N-acetyltransferase [Deinococcus irradiatisoli]